MSIRQRSLLSPAAIMSTISLFYHKMMIKNKQNWCNQFCFMRGRIHNIPYEYLHTNYIYSSLPYKSSVLTVGTFDLKANNIQYYSFLEIRCKVTKFLLHMQVFIYKKIKMLLKSNKIISFLLKMVASSEVITSNEPIILYKQK